MKSNCDYVRKVKWLSHASSVLGEALGPLIFVGSFPLLVITVRFQAGAIGLWRRFWDTVRAVPRTFHKLLFVIDLWYPPEFVPEAALRKDDQRAAMPLYWSWAVSADVFGKAGGFLLLGWLPYVIRFSAKASCVVWLPLLWVLRKPRPSCALRVRLGDVAEGKAEEGVRKFAVVVGLAILGSAFTDELALFGIDIKASALGGLADFWLITQGVKGWHIACAICVAITFAIYYLADHYLRRLKHKEAIPDAIIANGITIATRLRLILAMYVIAKGFVTVVFPGGSSFVWAGIQWW